MIIPKPCIQTSVLLIFMTKKQDVRISPFRNGKLFFPKFFHHKIEAMPLFGPNEDAAWAILYHNMNDISAQ